jgi:hypothetical protein
VAGGLIGAAGALMTGTLLLVPMAVVVGALTDALGHHCEVCGDEIEGGESAYCAMEELDDGVGGRSYKHAGSSQEPMPAGLQKHGVSSPANGFQGVRETPECPRKVDEHPPEESHHSPLQGRLVFDQEERRLVQAGLLPDEGAIDTNSSESFDSHASIDFGEQRLYGFEPSPWDSGTNEFPCFHDDTAAGIDHLESTDDTQIEGV